MNWNEARKLLEKGEILTRDTENVIINNKSINEPAIYKFKYIGDCYLLKTKVNHKDKWTSCRLNTQFLDDTTWRLVKNGE
jgi:hypothetical protein